MFSAVYVVAVFIALLVQTSPLLFTVGPDLRVDLPLVVVIGSKDGALLHY
jgi:hypothetical protein